MTIDGLAPGEEQLATESFSPSLILFWLKFQVTVTNRRIVARQPNTLLGVIPLGYEDLAIPLKSVAGVGVSVKFSMFRFLLGLVVLIVGLASFGSNTFLGLIVTLLGVVFLAGSVRAVLKIQNNAGSAQEVRVAYTEKAKLEQFRGQIDQQLHAAE